MEKGRNLGHTVFWDVTNTKCLQKGSRHGYIWVSNKDLEVTYAHNIVREWLPSKRRHVEQEKNKTNHSNRLNTIDI